MKEINQPVEEAQSVENPSQRKKDAIELIRSYVTCSNERQREIKEEGTPLTAQVAGRALGTENGTTQKVSADRASPRPRTRDREWYHSESDHDQGGHWSPRTIGQAMKMIYPNLGCVRKLIRLQQEFRILKSPKEPVCRST
ncbi:hypothetical protein Tco_0502683 [Tanacetum coccineum]